MLTTLAIMVALATAPQPDTEMTVGIRLSIGSWVSDHARTIEAPAPRQRIRWAHGRAKMAGYVGLWLGDLISTELLVGKPYKDTGLVWQEGNPFPGMGSRIGRAIIIPGFGLGCAYVDRQLSIHGHVRWARAWRIVTYLIEITSTLANLKVTPWDWSIVGVMSHSGIARTH